MPFAAAPPLAAQEQPADPYIALVSALDGAVDRETVLQSIIAQTGQAMLANDPALAALEARYPGMVQRLLVVMTPMIREHSQAASSLYQREIAGLMRRDLTATEARDAFAFYASPLGRRVLGAAAGNINSDALVQEAATEGADVHISEAAVEGDLQRGIAAAVGDLTAADRAEMLRRLTGKSWVEKIGALMPEMITLRAASENTPLEPALQQRMFAAIRAEVAAVQAESWRGK